MYAALHVSQGPPTHRVAWLTVRALLQLLLSYLPVFPPKSLPTCCAEDTTLDKLIYPGCIFSIIRRKKKLLTSLVRVRLLHGISRAHIMSDLIKAQAWVW